MSNVGKKMKNTRTNTNTLIIFVEYTSYYIVYTILYLKKKLVSFRVY